MSSPNQIQSSGSTHNLHINRSQFRFSPFWKNWSRTVVRGTAAIERIVDSPHQKRTISRFEERLLHKWKRWLDFDLGVHATSRASNQQFMFQHRRRLFASLTVLLFIQAAFYFVHLHLKKQSITFTLPPTSPKDDESAVLSTPTEFSDASFSLLTNLAEPNPTVYQSLPNCSTSNGSRVTIDQTLVSFSKIEQRYGHDLYPGGHWFPRQCRSTQRVALIVCYRHRESHLKLFLHNIHQFLQDQQIDYTIFVVNQHGTNQFNRAALFDVGFLEARKLYPFDCFIFHDVDLLPEDRRNRYVCGDRPRHMSVAVDKFKYQLLYATLFGGVTAFHVSDFLACNGYPTIYWGWGGEDDDMYLRVVKKLGKAITRYPIGIARYKMIRSMNHTSGQINPHRHRLLNSKYNYNQDGLSSLRYRLHEVLLYQLFTLVNVTLFEESYQEMQQRLNVTILPRPKKKKNGKSWEIYIWVFLWKKIKRSAGQKRFLAELNRCCTGKGTHSSAWG